MANLPAKTICGFLSRRVAEILEEIYFGSSVVGLLSTHLDQSLLFDFEHLPQRPAESAQQMTPEQTTDSIVGPTDAASRRAPEPQQHGVQPAHKSPGLQTLGDLPRRQPPAARREILTLLSGVTNLHPCSEFPLIPPAR